MKALQAIDHEAILSRMIDPIGTELQTMQDQIAGMATIEFEERTIELPGYSRHLEILLKAIALFKDKKKKNVMPLQFATIEDITIEQLRPEIFGLDTFSVDVTAVGTVNIIPTGAGVHELTKDEEVIVLLGFIEYATTPIITAIQITADEEKYKPVEVRHHLFNGISVYPLDYPIIVNVSLDIDAKAEATGTTKLTPYGLHIALGSKIPDLT